MRLGQTERNVLVRARGTAHEDDRAAGGAELSGRELLRALRVARRLPGSFEHALLDELVLESEELVELGRVGEIHRKAFAVTDITLEPLETCFELEAGALRFARALEQPLGIRREIESRIDGHLDQLPLGVVRIGKAHLPIACTFDATEPREKALAITAEEERILKVLALTTKLDLEPFQSFQAAAQGSGNAPARGADALGIDVHPGADHHRLIKARHEPRVVAGNVLELDR